MSNVFEIILIRSIIAIFMNEKHILTEYSCNSSGVKWLLVAPILTTVPLFKPCKIKHLSKVVH